MSSTSHPSELELLRGQVVDLSRELASRDRLAQNLCEQSDRLRAIVEGTAAKTGEEFFASLVTHLTSVLKIQYSVIGEVQGDRIKKIRTLAVSAGGALVDNFEYELAHTPCATALMQPFACFDRDLQTMFLQFQRLADLGAESYCGVPLRAKDGTVIGLLVVMDTKPFQQAAELQSLLGIFAPRVAVEFERRRAEQDKAQALADLHNVIETIPDIVFALDTQGNLVKWNRRLVDVTGYSPEELSGMSALAFVPMEEQASTAAAIQRAFTEGYAELEGHLLTKDHRLIPYHWTGALLKNSHGVPIGITGIGRDVSEKKRAEEVLQKSEQHFALAVEGSTDILWDAQRLPGEPWYAPQTSIWWSPRVRELLGLQESESFETFEQWATRLHPDDKDRVFGQLAAHMEYRVPYDVEYRLRTNADGYCWIHGRGQAQWDEQGEPCRMSGSCQDITERKQVEEALREREEALARFKVTLDQTHDCVFMFAPDTLRFIYCNRRAIEQVGYTEAELFTMTPLDIKPEFTEQSFHELLDSLRDGRKSSCVFETVHRHKDGHNVAIEVSLQLVREQGVEGRFVAVVRDITERKQADEALRASEERFNLAVRGSNTGIWDWDLRTGKTYFSPLWKSMLGYEEHELKGEFFEWEQRLHPDDRERALATVRAYLEGTIPQYELEHRLRHKDESYRWILARGVSLPDAVGAPYRMAGSHIDITELKQTQDSLAQRERELRTILDALPVGVWFIDRAGKPLLVNPVAKQIWSNIKQIGLQIENSQSSWWETLGPANQLHRWALGHTLTTGESSLNETLDFECLDGTKKVIRNSTVPVRDESGNILGAIVLNEDITLLRKAQEALKLTQFSVDQAIEGFFWISPEGRIFNVNDAACRMLEYTREELTAMTVPDIDPNFPSEAWPAHWDELKQKGSLTFESKHWSRSGRILDTEVTLNYLRYEGTEYNCAIMRDIGERKRVEEALRKSQARLHAITDAVPGAVYQYQLAVDGTQRFLFMSQGIQALIGVTSAEAGNDFSAVWACIFPEDVGEMVTSIRRSAETLSPWHHEFRIVHADGAIRWIRGNSVPELPRDDGSIVWSGILIDITEHKRAEHESHERIQCALVMQAALLQLARFDNQALTFIEGIQGVTEVASNTLAVERVSLWLLSEDGTELICQDLYSRSQTNHSNGDRLIVSASPHYFAAVEDSLVMALSDVLADPRTSELVEDYLLPPGIVSMMDVPIRRNGKLIGVMRYEHVGVPRVWGHEVQSFGVSVGESVAHMMETAERKRAEEALRASEERYRSLLDNAPIGIFLNEEGRFAYVNQEMQRILHATSAEQLIGTTVLDRIAPEFHQVVKDRIHTLMDNRQPVPSLDEQFVRLDESRVDVAVTAIPADFDGMSMMQVLVLDVTERKRAEKALRLAKFSMDRASDAVYWIDNQAKILDVNEAATFMLGYSKDELCSMTVHDLNPNFQADMWPRFWEEAKQRGTLVIETVHRAKNGQIIPIEVSVNYLFYEGMDYHCAFVRDITERKRAEEALTRSRDLLKSFVEHTPAAVAMLDKDLRYVAFSRRWLQDYRLGDQDLTGRRHYDIFPEIRAMAEWQAIYQRCLAGAVERRVEDCFVREDGSEDWLRWEVRPWHDVTGAIGGIMMFTEVVNERKRAEEELRQSNAFLRQVLDINPNFIFAKDRDGRFTLANKAVADAYGTTMESLIGKTDADFNPNQEEVGFFRQKDLLVLDSLQDLFTSEEMLTDSAGKRRWLQTVKRPILNGEGKANMILGASTDITERKHMEDELRKRERELQVAIGERERISQDLHDGILQSLFAVGLALESVKLTMSPRNLKMSRTSLNQAIDQLNDVMREIRNFIAGLGSDLLRGKQFPAVLKQMLASLTEHQATRVHLAVEGRAAKALSTEQSLHLIRVIQEAVSNCIKHGHAREARVSLKMLKRSVRLSVRDNGRGFNQDDVKGIGHGLGNMAARAQKIGGRFAVLSKVNEGTSIVLDFPKEAADVSR